jgi:hypothetical protein
MHSDARAANQSEPLALYDTSPANKAVRIAVPVSSPAEGMNGVDINKPIGMAAAAEAMTRAGVLFSLPASNSELAARSAAMQ